MKQASLFSGIGGFDLAAEWMNWENVFHCEWNEFGQKILKYYWPNAISYEDITKTDFTIHRGTIDVLTGGFPCQGFSVAGLRKGTTDHRFLWPEMRRAYKELQPTWIIAENVTGLITMADKREVSKDVFFKVEGRKVTRLLEVDQYEAIYIRQTKMLLESICQDLEKDGYEVQPIIIPAASVQAPHRRERIWIIANSDSEGLQGGIQSRFRSNENQARTSKRRKSTRTHTEEYWAKFPTQSPLCFRNDGISSKLDGITFSKFRNESIKGAGNAIVPQVAYEIFKVIQQLENDQQK